MFKWIQSQSNPSKPSSSQPAAGPSSATTAPTSTNVALDSLDNASSSADGPDLKRFGMENFGNTCYANSVLQALYFCQPFRDLLIAAHDALPPPTTAVQAPLPPPATPAATSTSPAKRTPSTKVAAPPHKRNLSLTPDDVAAQASSSSDPPLDPPPPIPSNPATLYLALRSLFFFIAHQQTSKGVVAPQAFVAKLKKENILFRSSMHQDAHEFLNYLLNKVVEDLEEEGKNDVLTKSISSMNTSTSTSTAPSATSLSATPPPAPPPLIQSLFQGTLTNETRCLTCERVTSRSEPFLDLSLDISQNTSLNACLRHFSKSEMLTARNKFFCDECCGLVEAEKRMKIKTLPPILLLHLKRFKYQEDLQKYIKLSYRVAFPLELRLYNNTVDPTSAAGDPEGRGRRGGQQPQRERTLMMNGDGSTMGLDEKEDREVKGAGSGGPGDPEGLYRLFAVVVHIGGGPHHGHYVTLVKSPTTWLLFDDDSVEPIRESDIPKYFGDAAFTVEAAVNAARDPVPAATAAAGGAGTAAGGGTAAMSLMGVAGAGGLSTSAKVLAANPSGAPATAGAKAAAPVASSATNPNSVITGILPTSPATTTGTTGPTVVNASLGSGYVLFYQAADMDLKGLGLMKAAREATETGEAMLKAKVTGEEEEEDLTPGAVPIFVEEPEEERLGAAGSVAAGVKSSPSFTATSSSPASVAIQFQVPASPSGVTSASSDVDGGSSSVENGRAAPRRQGLSLDIMPLTQHHNPEDQLSPLVLPPSIASGSGGGGGFFKSLKHSASVKVEKSSGGGGLGGFGLGMSSPSPFPAKAAVVSTPAFHVMTASPPPPPPIPIKEKEKEKEKSSHWFSTARKSVKRRSKNKDAHKEKEDKDHQNIGTASFSSTEGRRVPADGFDSGLGVVGHRDDRRASEPASLPEPRLPAEASPRPSSMVAVESSPAAVPPLPLPPAEGLSASPQHFVTPLPPSPSLSHSQVLSPPFPRKYSGFSPAPPVTVISEPTAAPPAGLRVPSSTKLPLSPTSQTSPISVPSSPVRNGRFTAAPPPRKSLTLFDTSSFAIGVSPIPRTATGGEKDGSGGGGGGLMKRASRKMSLNSSSMRLSGFGWHKDKDRDHR